MTSRDFVFWLQGFFEVSGAESLGLTQTQTIKRHLDLVFAHEIDPPMGNAQQQQYLNKIHNPQPQIAGLPHGGAVRC